MVYLYGCDSLVGPFASVGEAKKHPTYRPSVKPYADDIVDEEEAAVLVLKGIPTASPEEDIEVATKEGILV